MKRTALLRTVIAIGAAFALVALMGSMAVACPNCQNALAEDPAGNGLARGFYWSILLMMSMPFALVAGFGGLMYLEVRKAARQGFYDLPSREDLPSDNPQPS